jgi:hypothetical protein
LGQRHGIVQQRLLQSPKTSAQHDVQDAQYLPQ